MKIPDKVLIDTSIDNIQRIIRDDYPEIEISSIQVIGDGWDNLAIEVNNQYIFRFPHNLEVQLAKEINILNYLKDKISLQIPLVKFIGKEYRYMGYEKINGDAISSETLLALNKHDYDELVKDWANFLFELHSKTSIEQISAWDIKQHKYQLNTLEGTPFDHSIKDSTVLEFIKSTIKEYKTTIETLNDSVLLHGDLHSANIAFDVQTNRLIGIFDFGDTSIGDRTLDFHSLYKFNKKFLEDVAKTYQDTAKVSINLRNVVLHSRINEIMDLAEFIEKPSSDIYTQAIERIRLWNKEIDIYKYR